MPRTRSTSVIASVVATALLGAACGDDDSSTSATTDPGVTMEAAVQTYADGVHASYAASLASAIALDEAIDGFLDMPDEETLAAARQAWLDARDDYGFTEAFRFYGGPIDDEQDGPEGLINAWPLDEAYIDYVEGAPGAGIINDRDSYPTIDADLLVSLNERGGETNISTGWHAIEFLLWGQDLDDDGPGARPAADYADAPNADRRAAYLAVASDLLVDQLGGLVDAWDPAVSENYRAEFLARQPQEAMTDIVTGLGELSRGELAGERINVAYVERSQEDEHSCFSDNTTADIVANATGVQMVLEAAYPGGVTGTSVLDVVAAADGELAERLRREVGASVAAVAAIPAPFDRNLADGVPDSDPGRMAILAGIEALEAQTPTLVSAAEALGLTINVS